MSHVIQTKLNSRFNAFNYILTTSTYLYIDALYRVQKGMSMCKVKDKTKNKTPGGSLTF